ncbi:MAG: nucleotidyltransferase domain-containing protein [Nitrospirota bacterium]|nr:nucleotidyltransferase domain-containing protein [Nitrospirota bacterium]
MTIEDIKETLSPVFERQGNVLFAYLFGSVAKGEISPSSDLDIAFYLTGVRPEAFFENKLSLHANICRALKRDDADLAVLNAPSNTMLIEEIIRHGIVMYDSDTDAREGYEVMALLETIDFRTQRRAVMGI